MLCVVFMTIPFIVNSVGAIDTIDAKTAFSVAYMNSLPEEGKADFDKFSGEFERGEVKDQSGNMFYNTLKNKKIYKKVKYPDGQNGFYTKDVKIRERAIYEKIKNKVRD